MVSTSLVQINFLDSQQTLVALQTYANHRNPETAAKAFSLANEVVTKFCKTGWDKSSMSAKDVVIPAISIFGVGLNSKRSQVFSCS